MVKEENWKTEMKVGEGIVDLLSSKLYRTIPITLRELVSNAWDADATNVEIIVNEERGQIVVIDDGSGMSKDTLQNYPNIAMTKKSRSPSTPIGRPVIGHYGIGILSALPFCKKITVQTTVMGSDEINSLEIESSRWIDDEGRRKPHSTEALNVTFPGRTFSDPRIEGTQGTTIVLEDIFPSVWKEFVDRSERSRKDIGGYSGIDRIKWYLQQYSPIEYHSDAHPYVDFFKNETKYPPMKVFLNGNQLFRNSIENVIVLEEEQYHEFAQGSIKCRYQIITPLRIVSPIEMRGLQIRMKNTAVGMPTHFDVYKKEGRLYGRMAFISGEIEIIEGLEEQLSLDRENIITCPEWIEFSDYFRERLAKLADRVDERGNAEKFLGALAVSGGIKPENATFGFLAGSSVRPGTKQQKARSAKSDKELVKKARQALQKIDYKVKPFPENEKPTDNPVVVNHKEKTVYIQETAARKKPIIKIENKEVFEVEGFVDNGMVATMVDKNSIAFNYSHPLFKNVRDAQLLKEIVSSIYYLSSQGELTPKGLAAFNKILDKTSESHHTGE